MNSDEFSRIGVSPHPATYIPQPSSKKRYVPPMKRDLHDTDPPSMDLLTFPSLNTTRQANNPPVPLNFLSKLKEAEAKREEESIYDLTRNASMTKRQLLKEGWAIVTRAGVEYDDTIPLLKGKTSEIKTSPLPFHPDSPRPRRKIMTSMLSYTDLYDIDYENDDTGAIVPVYDAHCDGDDGENSV
jgi:hypothetical protein